MRLLWCSGCSGDGDGGVVVTLATGKKSAELSGVPQCCFASVTISVPVTIEAEFNGQALAGCWQTRDGREGASEGAAGYKVDADAR